MATLGGEMVLVTGGSGYIAGWIIARLLDEGAAVRATLRDPAKAEQVRANIATAAADTSGLTFATADLLADRGWDEAMAGVRSVIRVASPVMARKGVDTIGTAVGGTERVLGAATRAGVARVVVTSSAAAAIFARASAGVIDEAVWTDLRTVKGDYPRSKTLADRAAWTFAKTTAGAPALATVLPGFVQGPLLGEEASASLGPVRQMLAGQMPKVPRLGFTLVDVRDLADLHVRVLTERDAIGERWLGGADFLWLADIAAVLREEFGAAAAKVPTRTVPDWLVRLTAIVNPALRPITGDLGQRRALTSAKAAARLGWRPRSGREAVIATAKSVLARRGAGAVTA